MTPLDAARRTIGARFRLHGRDPQTGLDCVGLAALALRAGGCETAIPSGYVLRGGNGDAVARMIDGVLARSEAPGPGDLLLFASGPGQLHLAIKAEDGVIHADAVLRRVVERPGAPPWPLMAAWTIGDDAWRP